MMKIWADLTVEERKELQEHFETLWLNTEQSLVDIAKELNVSYERARCLKMRFERKMRRQSNEVICELNKEET